MPYDIGIDIGIDIDLDASVPAEIDSAAIQAAIAATLQQEGIGTAALTVAITSDEAVQALNRDFRGIDAPTDVLSFAARHEDEDTPDLVLPPEIAAELESYLGDLVIAFPYSARQALHFGNSITAELQLLSVHGTLHLPGYDHEEQADEEAMWAIQEQILAQFGHGALARRVYEV